MITKTYDLNFKKVMVLKLLFLKQLLFLFEHETMKAPKNWKMKQRKRKRIKGWIKKKKKKKKERKGCLKIDATH